MEPADSTADERSELLRSYPRAICHLRQQLESDQLGLIFGAGASLPYGFPAWGDLLERIGSELQVEDWAAIGQLSPAMRAEVLFHRFRQAGEYEPELPFASRAAMEDARWRKLVHDCLFQTAPEVPPEDVPRPYHWFAPVVEKSGLTINYNFDDTLERVLQARAHSRDRDPRNRGYEVVLEPLLSRRVNPNARVYHPNGYLPRVFHDGSTFITFSQTGFADQLLQSGTAEYAPLLTLLRLQTFLLIGLSLDDEILRNVLRQHSRVDVSSVHYYVKYLPEPTYISDRDRRAIRSANFETFNLITLFLDDTGMHALADLLAESRDAFVDDCARAKQPFSRTFYITGAIGSGKSAVTRSFRDLITFDEWSVTRPAELNVHPRGLSQEELRDADEWIATQMRIRNRNIAEARRYPGLHIVDRTPLDPLIFTPDEDYQAKGARLREEMAVESTPISNGQIFVLIGDPEELRIRIEARFKQASKEDIEHQQDLLISLFPEEWTDERKNIKHMNIDGLTLRQLVKQIVREIHLGDNERFDEADLGEKLEAVISGRLRLPSATPNAADVTAQPD
jgi:hypothetical protein